MTESFLFLKAVEAPKASGIKKSMLDVIEGRPYQFGTASLHHQRTSVARITTFHKGSLQVSKYTVSQGTEIAAISQKSPCAEQCLS